MTTSPDLSTAQLSLRLAVSSLEKDVAQLGWDRSPSLFAFVYTKSIFPQLAGEMDPTEANQLRAALAENPQHLTAVLQDHLPPADLMDTLGHLVFGEDVAGVAVSMERFLVSRKLMPMPLWIRKSAKSSYLPTPLAKTYGS